MSATPGKFLRIYGPWAIVTGASDGIGAAFAAELARLGLNLVLVARNAERLGKLASQLKSEFAIEIRILPLDLAKPGSAKTMFAATDDLDTGLLVAAAGFGTSGPALLANDEAETQLVDVNCTAVLQQCLHFARRMALRRRGGIVMLSSVLAFQGTPLSANYAASKAYVQSLAEALGEELKSSGVAVLSVAPGPVATGFAARANMILGKTLTPQIVAKASLAALGRQRTVRPGWLSKLLGWGLSTAPRMLRVRIIGRIMQNMTKHQHAAKT